MARFKKTDTITIKGNFVHINRDYCAFYALEFNEFCKVCPDKKDEPDCFENCTIINFMEFVEKQWKICGYFNPDSPRKKCMIRKREKLVALEDAET